MPNLLPTTTIGSATVSRLICGSNPFLGYSYRSSAHDAWQRRTMTPERIALILEKCLEHGVNTMLGNYDDDHVLARARQICEKAVGQAPQWIAYTHGGGPRQIETIDMLADWGATAIYIQGGTVDMCFQYNFVGGLCLDQPDTLDCVIPWLAHIRERGCTPGLGTHRAPIICLAEERGYDAEFYITPLNAQRVYCDYADAVATINQVKKPIITIKTLGGSAKVSPEEGFTTAFTALKKTDCIAVGMENEEIVGYNAQLTRSILGWLDGKVM
jgi:hypothetical protein